MTNIFSTIKALVTAGFIILPLQARAGAASDSLSLQGKSLILRENPTPHPWKAAAEVTAINIFVWGADFAQDKTFSKINWKSIQDNFSRGMVWDFDGLATNLFGHPYHGALYHNAAREHGLNFWQSIPYNLAGSAMWEFIAEIEPPAINDVIATTLGGAMLGEISHRASRLALRDNTRGLERAGREAAYFLVNPIGGINRLLSGDTWKYRSSAYLYHDYDLIPVKVSLSAGGVMLTDNKGFKNFKATPYLRLGLEYGEAFDAEQNSPFDFFTAEVIATPSSKQRFLNSIQLLGRLWGSNIDLSDSRDDATFGIYQYYNYYNGRTSNRLCETVSYGPGLIYKWNREGFVKSIQEGLFAGAIVLGGAYTDYFRHIDRDYSMGCGFSLKSMTKAEFRHGIKLDFEARYYRIYTFLDACDNKDFTDVEPLFYNTLGNEGNYQMAVLHARIEKSISRNMGIELIGDLFRRCAHYRYQQNAAATNYELKAGLVYSF